MKTLVTKIDGREREIIQNPWTEIGEALKEETGESPTIGQILDRMIELDERGPAMFSLKQTFIEDYGWTQAVILKTEE